MDHHHAAVGGPLDTVDPMHIFENSETIVAALLALIALGRVVAAAIVRVNAFRGRKAKAEAERLSRRGWAETEFLHNSEIG